MKTMMAVAAFALASGNVVLTARAQAPGTMALLVGNAEYDAATGALINPNFLQGPPVTLYAAVASESYLYVVSGPYPTIAKYDLRTGALINPNFIFVANPSGTPSLALKGNTLYVAVNDSFGYGDTVATYDATTGALINSSFVAGPVLIEHVLISGNTLFVSGFAFPPGGTQGSWSAPDVTASYDATTGALISSTEGGQAIAVGADYLFSVSTTGGSGGVSISATNASVGPSVYNIGNIPVYCAGAVGDTLFVLTPAEYAPPNRQAANWYIVVSNPTDPRTAYANEGVYDYPEPQAGVLVNPPPFIVIPMPAARPAPPPPPVAKDFNGDGTSDLVWENSRTGQHDIWLLQNCAHIGTITLPKTGLAWHLVGVGSIEGSGHADLVWENIRDGEHSVWLLRNGLLAGIIPLPRMPLAWHLVGVGDFNGERSGDLIWEHTNGTRVIWFLKNGVSIGSITLPHLGPQWHVAGVGDFNGDGQADLVMENSGNGNAFIWLLKNGTPIGTIPLPRVTAPWHIAGTGDFNGDGNTDLVLENGVSNRHVIWLLRNGARVGMVWLPNVPPAWHVANH
jgi:hypothetical protein